MHKPFQRTWHHAQTLLVGAILSPAHRTVTSALRILGLHHDPHVQTYHRGLNRASWSSRRLSHRLLMLLLCTFLPDDAPIVVGIDETIERRRGTKIAARGIYRDPVRSSKQQVVKTSGLRWISFHLLTPIPWIGRVWALPFFTVLAPSERSHLARGKRHKTITDWGRQMMRQLRHWLPDRRIVVVADSSYAVLDVLASCQAMTDPVTMVDTPALGCRSLRPSSAQDRTDTRASSAQRSASADTGGACEQCQDEMGTGHGTVVWRREA